jgi:hypothetical protein
MKKMTRKEFDERCDRLHAHIAKSNETSGLVLITVFLGFLKALIIGSSDPKESLKTTIEFLKSKNDD